MNDLNSASEELADAKAKLSDLAQQLSSKPNKTNSLWSIFMCLLVIILVLLKAFGLITLSWVWVFAPLWVPFVIILVLILIIIAFAFTR